MTIITNMTIATITIATSVPTIAIIIVTICTMITISSATIIIIYRVVLKALAGLPLVNLDALCESFTRILLGITYIGAERSSNANFDVYLRYPFPMTIKGA